MICMKHWILFLLLLGISNSLLAKSTCLIPIEDATGDFKQNSTLNERLKKHQKIKTIKFNLDLENLQSDKNSKIQLVFETTQSKKFETVYNHHNKAMHVWKVDFSTSQIFPQLFKNYLNITLYNSKYYLRLYDNPTEKTIVDLTFDVNNCSPFNKSNVLSRASVSR
jgi:hypothetical protein